MSARFRNPSAGVVFPKPNPTARLRLFCFPYAGGGASIFFAWPNALPAQVEVCAIQPPGRERRICERPHAYLPELLKRLGEELSPHMDKPFAFFGHSNGALTAFELTRKLRREGRRLPLHLFASGRTAPQLPADDAPIHALPEEAFLQEIRRLEGTPEEILENREMMELFIPLLRADFAIAETYRHAPEPPLDVPISAYGGMEDGEVREDELAAWRDQTAAAFFLRMFPGGHFFMNSGRQQLLEEMTRVLGRVLAQLDSPASSGHGE